MSEADLPKDYQDDPAARRAEWHRYYSEKRIGHQWFQVHLLQDIRVERVLEIGPNLGLVTALLDNAGYQVTTLDLLPSQYPRPHLPHIQADLTLIDADRLSGFDAILCCETLEHLLWERVDDVLCALRKAAPGYLIISVPFMGFQIEWRLYLNLYEWRSKFSWKKLNSLREFQFDEEADPWGHKWEVGYRGYPLTALEAKLTKSGWSICRLEFTSPTRSVFFVLKPS